MCARKSQPPAFFSAKTLRSFQSYLFEVIYGGGREQTGSCLALFPWKLKHEGDKLLLRHFQVGDRYTVSHASTAKPRT